ncbi:hypothetical protein CBL_03510 [Carabus blaptoides fortunei]
MSVLTRGLNDNDRGESNTVMILMVVCSPDANYSDRAAARITNVIQDCLQQMSLSSTSTTSPASTHALLIQNTHYALYCKSQTIPHQKRLPSIATSTPKTPKNLYETPVARSGTHGLVEGTDRTLPNYPSSPTIPLSWQGSHQPKDIRMYPSTRSAAVRAAVNPVSGAASVTSVQILHENSHTDAR